MATVPQKAQAKTHRYHAMLQHLVRHDFDEAAAAYTGNTSPAGWHKLMSAMLVLQQFEQLSYDDIEGLIHKPIHDIQEAIVMASCHRSIEEVLNSGSLS